MDQVVSRSKNGQYITFDILGELYIYDTKDKTILTPDGAFYPVDVFSREIYEVDINSLLQAPY